MPPRLTALALTLPDTVPFVGPEVQERARGKTFEARLGANENVFGPSPAALAALRDADAGIWQYADPTSHDLRQALAHHHGIAPENIVVGEGIDGLLGYLVRLLIAPGDKVVTSAGAYPTFNYHVAGFGGELITLPYVVTPGATDREDLPALIARAAAGPDTQAAKIVYLANPDNPMGSYWTGAEIAAALDHLDPGCILLLDEAYGEFAPIDAQVSVDIEDDRLIRFRTFSKAYGLAGARVGYAYGARSLINAFEKIRNHFGMNRSAQIAALAALQDQPYLAKVLDQVAAARAEIARIASDNGLRALESVTNFVTVDCGGSGDLARALVAALGTRGVFVRMPFVAPQDRCIRISCGRPQDLACLARALPAALAEARAQAQG